MNIKKEIKSPSFVEILDNYGESFNIRIFWKEKYNTKIGSMMSYI